MPSKILSWNNIPITYNHFPVQFSIPRIDDILSKFDTWYSSSAPVGNLSIHLQGLNNSWPTSGYYNPNIQNLYVTFGLAGQDVSIIINLQPVKFNIIIDTSMWVNLGDSSIAYTGAFTPADLTWGFWPGTARSTPVYNGKSYWSWDGGIYASPTGTMIIDLSTHNAEFLANGYKVINGDYYDANINCMSMNISDHGFFSSICSIGSLRSFWKYDISTNTGQNFNKSYPYIGYPIGDDYAPYPDGVTLEQGWYHEGGNTMYVLSFFNDYPSETALLQYHYDSSTMYRFDELGFRNASTGVPVQINGIPLPAGTPETILNETHGGRLFLTFNSSIWMYNISSSTGYFMSETGLFDGTSTINYDSSSLIPNFLSSNLLRSHDQYLIFGSAIGNEIWKYDVSNNKFIEKITIGEIVNEASIAHNFSGDPIVGVLNDFEYDVINHKLFLTTDSSWRSFYMFNLDEWTITQIDASHISNGNSVDLIANTAPMSLDTINKKMVFSAGGNTDLSDKSLYEIAY
jgi:hypothetical protein